MRVPLITLGVALLAAGAARADGGMNAEAERIAKLILQLGDASFAKRESAGKELAGIGEKTLPALESAVASPNPEIRGRAERVRRVVLLNLTTGKLTGVELCLVEPGTFTMGSLPQERGRRVDETQHRVRLSRPLLMGKYEVTQEQYQKLMKSNPSWFSTLGDGAPKVKGMDTTKFPVENVTWFDAVEYCNKLSEAEGYPLYYQLAEVKREKGAIVAATVTIKGGNGFRLPTEAEWEYACRATSTTWFHFGHTNSGRDANTRPGPATGYGGGPDWQPLGRTCKVGSYKPNLWGLHDMHGNVSEWCGDWYDRDYYAKSPPTDPLGPTEGTHRVQRGGSWVVAETSCRSASRAFHAPSEKTYYGGFRVARQP